MDIFKNRLAKALEQSNMNASKLSRKTGISKPLISYYLSGKCQAKQDNIYLIAKTLNVSEAWLMGFDVDTDLMQQIISKCQTMNDEQKLKVLEMINIILK